MDFQRREIHFSGRVQGVGFRYTVQRIAANHPVTGFVKNLPDGRVQLVAEGRKQEIEAFVRSIEQTMEANITGVNTTPLNYNGEFDSFTIER